MVKWQLKDDVRMTWESFMFFLPHFIVAVIIMVAVNHFFGKMEVEMEGIRDYFSQYLSKSRD